MHQKCYFYLKNYWNILCSMDDILSSWNLHSSKLTNSISYVGNEPNYFDFIEWNFELIYMYGGKIIVHVNVCASFPPFLPPLLIPPFLITPFSIFTLSDFLTCICLSVILRKTMFYCPYSDLIQKMEIGHLIPMYIVITASLSRIW